MKNIRNILAKGVFMLLVSLLAMACTEKSDWGIDASTAVRLEPMRMV